MAVTFKITWDTIQYNLSKKQELLGFNVTLNEIIAFNEIEDVQLPTGKNDEIVIKYDAGRSSVTFSSPKRDTILKSIRSARSRLQKPVQDAGRVIRPSDVPGTLLNMALLNMGSEDPDLRLTSYNLLCALSIVFNLDVGNTLLQAKGKFIFEHRNAHSWK